MSRYIALLAFSLLTGCRSNSYQPADNLHWVYGRSLPLIAPVKQTNFEINFFESVGLEIERGFRKELRGNKNVSIEPIAMWTVFTYPAEAHLEIRAEVYEDVTDMTGWVLGPDGSLSGSNNTNKTQLILVRQKNPGRGVASARLTMLLQVERADSTNFVTAVLPFVWHDGTLENGGLRLNKEAL